MKNIKYKLQCGGTDDEPLFVIKTMGWNETNEGIAQREAYNGEYTIEDDGLPEPVPTPSPAERIAALEEQLNMLLSGVTSDE